MFIAHNQDYRLRQPPVKDHPARKKESVWRGGEKIQKSIVRRGGIML